MSGIPYKYYRLYVTKTKDDLYTTVYRFSLYEGLEIDAIDIAPTGVATASSQYDGNYIPQNAINNNDSKAWSSTLMTGSAEWLMVELPTAKVVRSIGLMNAVSMTEMPVDFKIQGSNDASSWVDIYSEQNNTSINIKRVFSISVSGISKIDTGERAVSVIVRDWESGALLSKATPNEDGYWAVFPKNLNPLLVTHIGPSGYEPKSDGPVTPYSW